MKIAVMQPYFYPYLGYFELFQKADIFVSFDCVQYIKRGFMNRNTFIRSDHETAWVTVPVEKAPRHTIISQIKLANDFEYEMEKRCRNFPVFSRMTEAGISDQIFTGCEFLSDYLVNNLKFVLKSLQIDTPIISSKSLNIDPNERNQQRIINICKKLGASGYVNLSGGSEIYDSELFADQNINLEILPPYEGKKISVLEELF